MILFKDLPSAFDTPHTNTPTTLPSGASGEPKTSSMGQEIGFLQERPPTGAWIQFEIQ